MFNSLSFFFEMIFEIVVVFDPELSFRVHNKLHQLPPRIAYMNLGIGPLAAPAFFLWSYTAHCPRFFVPLICRDQSAGKWLAALASKDRRALRPSILFFASPCHITREICPPRTRLPYRRRSCQRCVVHHPEGKEPNRNRIALRLDSVRRRYHSRLLL